MVNTEGHENVAPGGDDWFSRMIEPFDPPGDDNPENVLRSNASESQSILEDSEEACRANVGSTPVRPSQQEVDARMITHLPFRSWCPHCVRGKSKGKPHSRAKTGDTDCRDRPHVHA